MIASNETPFPKPPDENENLSVTPSGKKPEIPGPQIFFPGHALKMKCRHLREERIRGWSVQLEFPVDNPVNNVRRSMRKGWVTFLVPINFPEIHRLTLSDLLMLAEHTAQSTGINSP